MSEPTCRYCGQRKEEHHDFDPHNSVEGYVCDSGTWWPNPVGPICAEYKGDGKQNCAECEHDQSCHAVKP